jgi:hypothetical protein
VLQERSLGQLLLDLGATALHHGCCVGADAQAHTLARTLGLRVVGHPPVNQSKMAADLDCDEWREPEPYLDRNHTIVDETAVLLATPEKMREELRSGTWATVRYCRTVGRALYVHWPNGAVTGEAAR